MAEAEKTESQLASAELHPAALALVEGQKSDMAESPVVDQGMPKATGTPEDTASFKGQMAARYKERQSMAFHMTGNEKRGGKSSPNLQNDTEQDNLGTEAPVNESNDIGPGKRSVVLHKNVPKYSMSLDAHQGRASKLEKHGEAGSTLHPRRSMRDLITQFERRSTTALECLKPQAPSVESARERMDQAAQSCKALEGGLAREAWRGTGRGFPMELDATADTSSNSTVSLSEGIENSESSSLKDCKMDGSGTTARKEAKLLRSASNIDLEVENVGTIEKAHIKESGSRKDLGERRSKLFAGTRTTDGDNRLSALISQMRFAGQEGDQVNTKTQGSADLELKESENIKIGITSGQTELKNDDLTNMKAQNNELNDKVPQPLRVNLKDFVTRKKRSSNTSEVKYVVHRKDWNKWMEIHQTTPGRLKQAGGIDEAANPSKSMSFQPIRKSTLGFKFLQNSLSGKPNVEGISVSRKSSKRELITSASNTQQRIQKRTTHRTTKSPQAKSVFPTTLTHVPEDTLGKPKSAMKRYQMFLNRTKGYRHAEKVTDTQLQPTGSPGLEIPPPQPLVSDKGPQLLENVDKAEDKGQASVAFPGFSLPPSTFSARRRREGSRQALQALLSKAREKDASQRAMVDHTASEETRAQRVFPQKKELSDLFTLSTGSLVSNANTTSTMELEQQMDRVLAQLEEVTAARNLKHNDTKQREPDKPSMTGQPEDNCGKKLEENLVDKPLIFTKMTSTNKLPPHVTEKAKLPLSEKFKVNVMEFYGQPTLHKNDPSCPAPTEREPFQPGSNRDTPQWVRKPHGFHSVRESLRRSNPDSPRGNTKTFTSMASNARNSRQPLHENNFSLNQMLMANQPQSQCNRYTATSTVRAKISPSLSMNAITRSASSQFVRPSALSENLSECGETRKTTAGCLSVNFPKPTFNDQFHSRPRFLGAARPKVIRDVPQIDRMKLEKDAIFSKNEISPKEALGLSTNGSIGKVEATTNVGFSKELTRPDRRRAVVANDRRQHSPTTRNIAAPAELKTNSTSCHGAGTKSASRSKSVHTSAWQKSATPTAQTVPNRITRNEQTHNAKSFDSGYQPEDSKFAKKIEHISCQDSTGSNAITLGKSSAPSTKLRTSGSSTRMQSILKDLSLSPESGLHPPSLPRQASPKKQADSVKEITTNLQSLQSEEAERGTASHITATRTSSSVSVRSKKPAVRRLGARRDQGRRKLRETSTDDVSTIPAYLSGAMKGPESPSKGGHNTARGTEGTPFLTTEKEEKPTKQRNSLFATNDIFATAGDFNSFEKNVFETEKLQEFVGRSPGGGKSHVSCEGERYTTPAEGDQQFDRCTTREDFEQDSQDLENKIFCHFGSSYLTEDEMNLELDDLRKDNSSPETSAKKRKRKMSEKMKKIKRKRRRKRVDDTETEKEEEQNSPDQVLQTKTVNKVGRQNSSDVSPKVATSRNKLQEANQTRGVLSVTIHKRSVSKSPAKTTRALHLPRYRAVVPLTNKPTQEFPNFSHIPLRMEGPDFVCNRKRLDLLAQYRRWRESMGDAEHPSKIPVSIAFRWTLNSAVIEEWALHCWEPDSGVYIDEDGTLWSSLSDTTTALTSQESLLADTCEISDIHVPAKAQGLQPCQTRPTPRYIKTNDEGCGAESSCMDISFWCQVVLIESQSYIRGQIIYIALFCIKTKADDSYEMSNFCECSSTLSEQSEVFVSNDAMGDGFHKSRIGHHADRFHMADKPLCLQYDTSNLDSNNNSSHVCYDQLKSSNRRPKMHVKGIISYDHIRTLSIKPQRTVRDNNSRWFKTNRVCKARRFVHAAKFSCHFENHPILSAFGVVDLLCSDLPPCCTRLEVPWERNNNSGGTPPAGHDLYAEHSFATWSKPLDTSRHTSVRHRSGDCNTEVASTKTLGGRLHTRRARRTLRSRPWKDPIVPVDTQHSEFQTSRILDTTEFQTSRILDAKEFQTSRILDTKEFQTSRIEDTQETTQKSYRLTRISHPRKVGHRVDDRTQSENKSVCVKHPNGQVNIKDKFDYLHTPESGGDSRENNSPNKKVSPMTRPSRALNAAIHHHRFHQITRPNVSGWSDKDLLRACQKPQSTDQYPHIKAKVQSRMRPREVNSPHKSFTRRPVTPISKDLLTSFLEGCDQLKLGSKHRWDARATHLREQIARKVEEVVMKKAQAIVKSYQEFLESQSSQSRPEDLKSQATQANAIEHPTRIADIEPSSRSQHQRGIGENVCSSDDAAPTSVLTGCKSISSPSHNVVTTQLTASDCETALTEDDRGELSLRSNELKQPVAAVYGGNKMVENTGYGCHFVCSQNVPRRKDIGRCSLSLTLIGSPASSVQGESLQTEDHRTIDKKTHGTGTEFKGTFKTMGGKDDATPALNIAAFKGTKDVCRTTQIAEDSKSKKIENVKPRHKSKIPVLLKSMIHKTKECKEEKLSPLQYDLNSDDETENCDRVLDGKSVDTRTKQNSLHINHAQPQHLQTSTTTQRGVSSKPRRANVNPYELASEPWWRRSKVKGVMKKDELSVVDLTTSVSKKFCSGSEDARVNNDSTANKSSSTKRIIQPKPFNSSKTISSALERKEKSERERYQKNSVKEKISRDKFHSPFPDRRSNHGAKLLSPNKEGGKLSTDNSLGTYFFSFLNRSVDATHVDNTRLIPEIADQWGVRQDPTSHQDTMFTSEALGSFSSSWLSRSEGICTGLSPQPQCSSSPHLSKLKLSPNSRSQVHSFQNIQKLIRSEKPSGNNTVQAHTDLVDPSDRTAASHVHVPTVEKESDPKASSDDKNKESAVCSSSRSTLRSISELPYNNPSPVLRQRSFSQQVSSRCEKPIPTPNAPYFRNPVHPVNLKSVRQTPFPTRKITLRRERPKNLTLQRKYNTCRLRNINFSNRACRVSVSEPQLSTESETFSCSSVRRCVSFLNITTSTSQAAFRFSSSHSTCYFSSVSFQDARTFFRIGDGYSFDKSGHNRRSFFTSLGAGDCSTYVKPCSKSHDQSSSIATEFWSGAGSNKSQTQQLNTCCSNSPSHRRLGWSRFRNVESNRKKTCPLENGRNVRLFSDDKKKSCAPPPTSKGYGSPESNQSFPSLLKFWEKTSKVQKTPKSKIRLFPASSLFKTTTRLRKPTRPLKKSHESLEKQDLGQQMWRQFANCKDCSPLFESHDSSAQARNNKSECTETENPKGDLDLTFSENLRSSALDIIGTHNVNRKNKKSRGLPHYPSTKGKNQPALLFCTPKTDKMTGIYNLDPQKGNRSPRCKLPVRKTATSKISTAVPHERRSGTASGLTQFYSTKSHQQQSPDQSVLKRGSYLTCSDSVEDFRRERLLDFITTCCKTQEESGHSVLWNKLYDPFHHQGQEKRNVMKPIQHHGDNRIQFKDHKTSLVHASSKRFKERKNNPCGENRVGSVLQNYQASKHRGKNSLHNRERKRRKSNVTQKTGPHYEPCLRVGNSPTRLPAVTKKPQNTVNFSPCVLYASQSSDFNTTIFESQNIENCELNRDLKINKPPSSDRSISKLHIQKTSSARAPVALPSVEKSYLISAGLDCSSDSSHLVTPTNMLQVGGGKLVDKGLQNRIYPKLGSAFTNELTSKQTDKLRFQPLRELSSHTFIKRSQKKRDAMCHISHQDEKSQKFPPKRDTDSEKTFHQNPNEEKSYDLSNPFLISVNRTTGAKSFQLSSAQTLSSVSESGKTYTYSLDKTSGDLSSDRSNETFCHRDGSAPYSPPMDSTLIINGKSSSFKYSNTGTSLEASELQQDSPDGTERVTNYHIEKLANKGGRERYSQEKTRCSSSGHTVTLKSNLQTISSEFSCDPPQVHNEFKQDLSFNDTHSGDIILKYTISCESLQNTADQNTFDTKTVATQTFLSELSDNGNIRTTRLSERKRVRETMSFDNCKDPLQSCNFSLLAQNLNMRPVKSVAFEAVAHTSKCSCVSPSMQCSKETSDSFEVQTGSLHRAQGPVTNISSNVPKVVNSSKKCSLSNLFDRPPIKQLERFPLEICNHENIKMFRSKVLQKSSSETDISYRRRDFATKLYRYREVSPQKSKKAAKSSAKLNEVKYVQQGTNSDKQNNIGNTRKDSECLVVKSSVQNTTNGNQKSVEGKPMEARHNYTVNVDFQPHKQISLSKHASLVQFKRPTRMLVKHEAYSSGTSNDKRTTRSSWSDSMVVSGRSMTQSLDLSYGAKLMSRAGRSPNKPVACPKFSPSKRVSQGMKERNQSVQTVHKAEDHCKERESLTREQDANSPKEKHTTRDIEIVLGDDVTVQEFMKCFIGGLDLEINNSGIPALSPNFNKNRCKTSRYGNSRKQVSHTKEDKPSSVAGLPPLFNCSSNKNHLDLKVERSSKLEFDQNESAETEEIQQRKNKAKKLKKIPKRLTNCAEKLPEGSLAREEWDEVQAALDHFINDILHKKRNTSVEPTSTTCREKKTRKCLHKEHLKNERLKITSPQKPKRLKPKKYSPCARVNTPVKEDISNLNVAWWDRSKLTKPSAADIRVLTKAKPQRRRSPLRRSIKKKDKPTVLDPTIGSFHMSTMKNMPKKKTANHGGSVTPEPISSDTFTVCWSSPLAAQRTNWSPLLKDKNPKFAERAKLKHSPKQNFRKITSPIGRNREEAKTRIKSGKEHIVKDLRTVHVRISKSTSDMELESISQSFCADSKTRASSKESRQRSKLSVRSLRKSCSVTNLYRPSRVIRSSETQGKSTLRPRKKATKKKTEKMKKMKSRNDFSSSSMTSLCLGKERRKKSVYTKTNQSLKTAHHPDRKNQSLSQKLSEEEAYGKGMGGGELGEQLDTIYEPSSISNSASVCELKQLSKNLPKIKTQCKERQMLNLSGEPSPNDTHHNHASYDVPQAEDGIESRDQREEKKPHQPQWEKVQHLQQFAESGTQANFESCAHHQLSDSLMAVGQPDWINNDSNKYKTKMIHFETETRKDSSKGWNGKGTNHRAIKHAVDYSTMQIDFNQPDLNLEGPHKHTSRQKTQTECYIAPNYCNSHQAGCQRKPIYRDHIESTSDTTSDGATTALPANQRHVCSCTKDTCRQGDIGITKSSHKGKPRSNFKSSQHPEVHSKGRKASTYDPHVRCPAVDPSVSLSDRDVYQDPKELDSENAVLATTVEEDTFTPATQEAALADLDTPVGKNTGMLRNAVNKATIRKSTKTPSPPTRPARRCDVTETAVETKPVPKPRTRLVNDEKDSYQGSSKEKNVHSEKIAQVDKRKDSTKRNKEGSVHIQRKVNKREVVQENENTCCEEMWLAAKSVSKPPSPSETNVDVDDIMMSLLMGKQVLRKEEKDAQYPHRSVSTHGIMNENAKQDGCYFKLPEKLREKLSLFHLKTVIANTVKDSIELYMQKSEAEKISNAKPNVDRKGADVSDRSECETLRPLVLGFSPPTSVSEDTCRSSAKRQKTKSKTTKCSRIKHAARKLSPSISPYTSSKLSTDPVQSKNLDLGTENPTKPNYKTKKGEPDSKLTRVQHTTQPITPDTNKSSETFSPTCRAFVPDENNSKPIEGNSALTKQDSHDYCKQCTESFDLKLGKEEDGQTPETNFRFIGPCSFYANIADAFLEPRPDKEGGHNVLLHLSQGDGQPDATVIVEPPHQKRCCPPRVLSENGYIHVVFGETSSSGEQEGHAKTQRPLTPICESNVQTDALSLRHSFVQTEEAVLTAQHQMPASIKSQNHQTSSKLEAGDPLSDLVPRLESLQHDQSTLDKEYRNNLLEMCTSLILNDMYNRHQTKSNSGHDKTKSNKKQSSSSSEKESLRTSSKRLTKTETSEPAQQRTCSSSHGSGSDEKVNSLAELNTNTVDRSNVGYMKKIDSDSEKPDGGYSDTLVSSDLGTSRVFTDTEHDLSIKQTERHSKAILQSKQNSVNPHDQTKRRQDSGHPGLQASRYSSLQGNHYSKGQNSRNSRRYDSAYSRHHNSCYSRRHERSDSRRHDSSDSRRHDSSYSRRHDSSDSRRHDSSYLRRHDSSDSRRHDSNYPRCQFQPVPSKGFERPTRAASPRVSKKVSEIEFTRNRRSPYITSIDPRRQVIDTSSYSENTMTWQYQRSPRLHEDDLSKSLFESKRSPNVLQQQQTSRYPVNSKISESSITSRAYGRIESEINNSRNWRESTTPLESKPLPASSRCSSTSSFSSVSEQQGQGRVPSLHQQDSQYTKGKDNGTSKRPTTSQQPNYATKLKEKENVSQVETKENKVPRHKFMVKSSDDEIVVHKMKQHSTPRVKNTLSPPDGQKNTQAGNKRHTTRTQQGPQSYSKHSFAYKTILFTSSTSSSETEQDTTEQVFKPVSTERTIQNSTEQAELATFSRNQSKFPPVSERWVQDSSKTLRQFYESDLIAPSQEPRYQSHDSSDTPRYGAYRGVSTPADSRPNERFISISPTQRVQGPLPSSTSTVGRHTPFSPLTPTPQRQTSFSPLTTAPFQRESFLSQRQQIQHPKLWQQKLDTLRDIARTRDHRPGVSSTTVRKLILQDQRASAANTGRYVIKSSAAFRPERRQRVRFSDEVTEFSLNESNNKRSPARPSANVDPMEPVCLESRKFDISKHCDNQHKERVSQHSTNSMEFPVAHMTESSQTISVPPAATSSDNTDTYLAQIEKNGPGPTSPGVSTSQSSRSSARRRAVQDRRDSGYSTPIALSRGQISNSSETSVSEWDRAIQTKLNKRIHQFNL